MKKKLLAIGVAASLGIFAGAASAAPSVNVGGIGHTNIIPYFSAQNGNATLISITNTDADKGKVVKVRFRGAEWSDDIFDFQVFLSPGDVFTGAVTASNGVAKFATADKSCTLPTSVNQSFVPIRLQNATSGTLEGYVEVITMADIPQFVTTSDGAVNGGNGLVTATNPTGLNPLFTAIKHVNGVAPCTSSVTNAKLENLIQDNFVSKNTTDVVQELYLANPGSVGSLTSYATIINVNASKAFSNVATAIVYNNAQKAYFRQANDSLNADNRLTADRIFYAIDSSTPAVAAGAGVQMYQFDLPDLSTPVDAATWNAGAGAVAVVNGDSAWQRNLLTKELQKSAVVAEYSTLDSLNAATDVVISQPTRRYFYNYTKAATGAAIGANFFTIKGDAGTPYVGLNGATNRIDLASNPVFWDREENKASSNIVISPTPPGGALSLKGEVSVLGINNGTGATGALGGLLTINDLTATGAGGAVFEEGWALITTASNNTTANAPTLASGDSAALTSFPGGYGAAIAGYASPSKTKLPVIGFSASNVFNGGAGAAGTNYGTTLPLRYLP